MQRHEHGVLAMRNDSCLTTSHLPPHPFIDLFELFRW
jgi:hypothetical protein